MKNLLLLIALVPAITMHIPSFPQQPQSLHDFTVVDIDGKPYSMASLKGKKVLIVNTASKCGHTPQYAELEKLYKEYKDKGLVIVGFPSNDFMGQEPGSNEDIKSFCSLEYGVTFPMMSKISVKGKDMHPLYKWLTSKSMNGVLDTDVSWNFQKFLVDENGKLVNTVAPRAKPYSEEILAWLNK